MEKDPNFMPKIDLFPRLSAISRFIYRVVTAPHQLASHGDHFSHWDEDPLASRVEPVRSMPGEKYCVLGIIPTSEWVEQPND